MRPHMSDLPLFLGRLLRRPHEISAVAPSSEALARAMAQQLPIDALAGPVIELGPGTGKITRAILARGVAPEHLHCFEMSSEFATYLSRQLPGVQVHNAPAQAMTAHGLRNVSAVVSGLPLLSMPKAVIKDILTASFAALRPGGRFIQFTYGPTPPIPEDIRMRFGLDCERGPKVWGNLPPARVYTFWQNPQ